MNFVSNMMKFVFKMMKYVCKMMNFVCKMMILIQTARTIAVMTTVEIRRSPRSHRASKGAG